MTDQPNAEQPEAAADDDAAAAREAAIAGAVADSLSPEVQLAAIQEAEASNNAAIQRLAAQGLALTDTSLLNLRLALFVEHALGDLSMPRRLDFEALFQARLAAEIATGEQQIARAKLLDGVRIDPRRQPPMPPLHP